MPTALHQVPDRDLLASFLADGDEQAFTHFVRRYANLVFGVCRRVLGNDADAEDAAQLVFVVLSQKAAELSDHENISGWLHRVSLHVALRHKQAGTRRARREAFAGAGATTVSESDREELHRRELRDVLDSELDQLPEEYRNPLILHYFHGKSQEEAAKQLGWSYGTVSGRLNRARVLLKERLERRGLAVSIALLALLFRDGNAAVPEQFVSETVGTVTDRLAGSAAKPAGTVTPRAASARPSPSTSRKLPMAYAAGALLVVLGSVLFFSRSQAQVDTSNPPALIVAGVSGPAAAAAPSPVSIRRISDAAAQADGSLLFLGIQTEAPEYRLVLGRLRNGIIDASYGSNGWSKIPHSLIAGNMVQQSTGAVIIVAMPGHGNQMRIVRIDPDGHHDQTFGTDGASVVQTMQVPGPIALAHIAVDSHDRIIVTGQFDRKRGYIARLDANGHIDRSFGNQGRITIADDTFCSVTWSAITDDDNIVMAGAGSSVNPAVAGKTCLEIMKYDVNGSLIPTFGDQAGHTTIDLGGLGPSSARPLIQPDGKIVVFGQNIIDATHSAPYVVRLDAAGTIDSSFGTVRLESERLLSAVNLSATGEILCYQVPIDGSKVSDDNSVSYDYATTGGGELRRIRSDGTIDREFGVSGIVALADTEAVLSLLPLADGGFITMSSAVNNPSPLPLVRRYDRAGKELPTSIGPGTGR
jgi:RNA polymerase sigma factor (sigma-70 family)